MRFRITGCADGVLTPLVLQMQFILHGGRVPKYVQGNRFQLRNTRCLNNT